MPSSACLLRTVKKPIFYFKVYHTTMSVGFPLVLLMPSLTLTDGTVANVFVRNTLAKNCGRDKLGYLECGGLH